MNTLRNKTKFWTQRSGMTHARWRAVQKLKPTRRYLHISAPIEWISRPNHPDMPIVARLGRDKHGRPLGTFNHGIQAAKRARRALAVRYRA